MSSPYMVRIHDQRLADAVKKVAFESKETGPQVVAKVLLGNPAIRKAIKEAS